MLGIVMNGKVLVSPYDLHPICPVSCYDRCSSQIFLPRYGIAGGAPMNAALLKPSSCLMVPLRRGQSLVEESVSSFLGRKLGTV